MPNPKHAIQEATGVITKRMVSRGDVQRRELFIEALWVDGVSERQILAVSKRELGLGPNATKKYLLRIRERVQAEGEEQRVYWKHQQVRRLLATVRRAKEEVKDATGKIVRHPDFSAAIAGERLLADLLGTREPVRVDLSIELRSAAAAVVASMDPKDLDALVAEYQVLEERAGIATPKGEALTFAPATEAGRAP